MEKTTNVVMIIWMVLAIAAFASSFFVPLIPKIIGLVFGAVNISLIFALAFDYFKNKKKNTEENGMPLQEE